MKNTKTLAKSLDWKLWLGLAISALFLYLAFRKEDLAGLWVVIRSVDLLPLTLVILITFFVYVVRAWRWGILLEPIKKTGFRNRLHSVFIGFAANCVLPARLGEFVRANYIGQAEKISRSSSFGTIVVERLFDGFTLLLILSIGLMGTHFPEQWQSISGRVRSVGFLLLISYILLIIVLVGFKYKAKPLLSLLERVLFFVPTHFRSRIIQIIWNFSQGLVLTTNPYRLFQIAFYSLLLWFTHLFQIQLIERSIGLTLPFIATFLILSMASFGVMIPSAPGFIGTFHAAVKWGFLLYGVGGAKALSAAIVWHATLFFPTILFGFISFLLLHTSLSKLSADPAILEKEQLSDNESFSAPHGTS